MSYSRLIAAALRLASATALLATVAPMAEAAGPKGPLDFKVKTIDGKDVDLKKYKGQVVLIVNTASKCGYTPQYASLEKLYGQYKAQGLKILAFPANDFGSQEPGVDADIKQFCTMNYKTSFDLFSKISTKEPAQAPLYKYLTSADTNGKFAGPIEWNFTKFLVDRKGNVVARFKSNVDPMSPEFTAAVGAALKQPK